MQTSFEAQVGLCKFRDRILFQEPGSEYFRFKNRKFLLSTRMKVYPKVLFSLSGIHLNAGKL
jgi:hypothetical protein